MSKIRFGRALIAAALAGALALTATVGCNSGDTDGGKGNDDAGVGNTPVSNGGFGAKLTIDIVDEPIPVGGRVGFFVTAVDPAGLPLAFRRVFCDSEKGIAILEPSNGGVAFEHTGPDGRMSGVLGGVHPGSFIIECRLEEGFNLVARKSTKVTGDIPLGFNGFPGAAGGNLGGGLIVDSPEDDDVLATAVLFLVNSSGSGEPNGPIDISRDTDCDDDPATNDPEPYFLDEYLATIQNKRGVDAFVTDVTISIELPSGTVTTRQLLPETLIPSGGSGEVNNTFTEVVGADTKVLVGTTTAIPAGTWNVTFNFDGEDLNGDDFDTTFTAAVTFANIDNCGA